MPFYYKKIVLSAETNFIEHWNIFILSNLSYSGRVGSAKSLHRRRKAPKTVSFSRAAKCQNSSKSHLLYELKKHHNFQVTLCLQNDTTNVDFAYIESE